MSDGAHFPVQDANDTRLGLVEDDIVDFVVAVDKSGAVLGLGTAVLKEGDHVVLMGNLANSFACFFVFGRGLRLRDCVEGGELSVVEARGLAIGGEADVRGDDAVEFGERGDGRAPPGMNASVIVRVGSVRGIAVRAAYMAVRSSAVTPGRAGSSKMRPSRKSMI